MTDSSNLENLQPDQIFDGGDLDCGSGLILLIRENMLKVHEGGVLEMRSREPTVGVDLPPWCRMVGHEYLGLLQTPKYVRYFMRRNISGKDDSQELQKDMERARSYEWRLRTRSTGHLKSTVYCRNFSFDVGQPASFEEKDPYPSAVEFLLGALSASLSTGFATEVARAGLEVDDIEITTKGRLENALALLGDENGEPVFSNIEIKCFASTFEDEKQVRKIWEQAVARSPIAATLRCAVEIKISFSVV
ncbi:hypothetical protein ANAEL_05517 [Anaerolineales bacterium]|nr:hypothetical protein ANAEL_05517 [Anaerolineales bacterium]